MNTDREALKAEWMARSRNAVLPYMMPEWENLIDEKLSKNGMLRYVEKHQIELALDIMERLQKGDSADNVAKYLHQVRKSSDIDIWKECHMASWYVFNFAKQGAEFFYAYNFNKDQPMSRTAMVNIALKTYEVECMLNPQQEQRDIESILIELAQHRHVERGFRVNFGDISTCRDAVYAHLQAAGKTNEAKQDFNAKIARAVFLTMDVMDINEMYSQSAQNDEVLQETNSIRTKGILERWAKSCLPISSEEDFDIDMHGKDVSILRAAQKAKEIILIEEKEANGFSQTPAAKAIMLSVIDEIIATEQSRESIADNILNGDGVSGTSSIAEDEQGLNTPNFSTDEECL